jgi:hypothetical protein
MVIEDHHQQAQGAEHQHALSARGSTFSFGKLHLWRLDELVSERPSESFTSGGLMNLFLKEA